MTREEQKMANREVTKYMSKALEELHRANDIEPLKGKRLRNCNALVFETESFYILKSYATYVACICKHNDTLYDALRIVYGYTATSAQHIAKFAHDYGAGAWGVSDRIVGR